MIGAQGDFAGFRLSSGAALGGMLDAVSDRITHEVDERIGNLLDDVVVQLGFAAGEIKLDLFAGGGGSIPYRARQARIEGADGHHASGGEFILQVVRELGEFV